MIIKGLDFRRTVGNDPEQYDVFDSEGNQVGYVWLRYGRVHCRYPNRNGPGIYYYDVGDRNWVGGFESEEQRMTQLTAIADKILGINKKEMCERAKLFCGKKCESCAWFEGEFE